MTLPKASIAILGAGSWGTALAMQAARGGEPTLLWGRDTNHVQDMSQSHCNQRYLPDIPLMKNLYVSNDIQQVVSHAQDILIAVPSHAFRSTLELIKPILRPEQRLLWATKGLEIGTGHLLHQVVSDVMEKQLPMAVLSGPTFAMEVAKGLPTAVTIAANDAQFAREMAERMHSEAFRVYTSTDMAGVEVGGSVKNVLAIAAGIIDGLGFGANTRSALITRGLAEMMRLGNALGGTRETFMGLAGMGDLVLTCTDDQSRNRRLGKSLGIGLSLEDALGAIDQVVEGVQTAREVHELAVSMGVDMPITEQVYLVLYEAKKPRAAVQSLLARDQKPELV